MKPGKGTALLFSRATLLVSAAALGLWGTVILRLKSGGLLAELQSPFYHPLSIGAAVICLALALLIPLILDPRAPANPPRWPALLMVGLLLLSPVLVFLLLPKDNPTSGLLARKYSPANNSTNLYQLLGVDLTDMRQDLAERRQEAGAGERVELDLLELNFITNNNDLKKRYDNTPVTLSGQCLHQAQDGKQSFRMVQMVMFCCAADALVLGLQVEGDPTGIHNGDWLVIDGILHFHGDSGLPYLVMQTSRPEDDAPPDDMPLPTR